MSGPTAIAQGISAAVDAARVGAAPFRDAVAALSTVDPSRIARLLGWVVRSLLEERHPDGLDSEDLRAVLTGCAAAWPSDADPTVLLIVLTGALGMSDPDEQPQVPPQAVATNATLLVACLLDQRPLAPYLDAAFAELRRAETVEMP